MNYVEVLDKPCNRTFQWINAYLKEHHPEKKRKFYKKYIYENRNLACRELINYLCEGKCRLLGQHDTGGYWRTVC